MSDRQNPVNNPSDNGKNRFMDQMLREQVFNIVDPGDDRDAENDGAREYEFEHQLLGCIQRWKSTD